MAMSLGINFYSRMAAADLGGTGVWTYFQHSNTAGKCIVIALLLLSLLAWTVMIFYLSSLSYEDIVSAWSVPSEMAGSAGVEVETRHVEAHLALYGVLTWLALLTVASWTGQDTKQLRWTLLCVGLATLYGLSDEYHQSFVPGRTASAPDVGLNALGSAAAIGYWAWTLRGLVWRISLAHIGAGKTAVELLPGSGPPTR